MFPETLKSEFHGIRATIEQYSNSVSLQSFNDASACGVMENAGNDDWNLNVRVVSKLGTMYYCLDRWD